MQKSIKLSIIATSLLVSSNIAWAENSIKLQPYTEMWYYPLASYDSAVKAGEKPDGANTNYSAFTMHQAGVKSTYTKDKLTMFVELRGVPSGSRRNYYDGDGDRAGWKNQTTYYGWAKYQLTDTGNLWAGKFKPLFLPEIIDQSLFGIGWQEQINKGELTALAVRPKDFFDKVNLDKSIATSAVEDSDTAENGYAFFVSYNKKFNKLHNIFGVYHAGFAKDKKGELEDRGYTLSQDTDGNLIAQDLGGKSIAVRNKSANQTVLGYQWEYAATNKTTLGGELAYRYQTLGKTKQELGKDGKNSQTGYGLYLFAKNEFKPNHTAGIKTIIGIPDSGVKKDLNTGEKLIYSKFNIGLFTSHAISKDFVIVPELTYKMADKLNKSVYYEDNKQNTAKSTWDFKVVFHFRPSLNFNL